MRISEALKWQRWAPCLAVLGLTLWGGFLRWPDESYWFSGDEAHYWAAAAAPNLAELREEIRYHPQPPLYPLLIRGWGSVSLDPWWLRLSSWVAGTLLIPLSYAWVRRVSGIVAGLAAAWLVTLSPGGIVLSAVLRRYMLLVLLLVVSLDALTRYLTTARCRSLVVFAAGMGAAVLVHYSAFIVLAGVGAYVLALMALRVLERPQVRGLTAALLPLATLAFVTYRWHIASFFRPGGPRDQAATYLHDQFAANAFDLLPQLTALTSFAFGAGPLLTFFVVLGVWLAVRGRQWAVAVLPAAVLPLAGVLSVLRLHPFGPTRHSLYLLPVLVLPAAHALSVLMRARRPWSFALGLAGVALIALAAAPLVTGGLAQHVRAVEVELNVPRAHATQVRDFLVGDGKRVTVFLTDQQTYWLLRPLLHLAGRAGWRTRVDENDIRLVTWEGRSFLVLAKWRMVGSPGDDLGKDHLAWMLDRLQRHGEWERAIEREEVWVIQGGLGHKLLPDLPEVHRAQLLRSPAVGGAEFFAFRLYPAAYRAYVGHAALPDNASYRLTPSSPRRRGSRQAREYRWNDWIPASAGMTDVEWSALLHADRMYCRAKPGHAWTNLPR